MKSNKYTWLIASALIFTLIFTRCDNGVKSNSQLQIGQTSMAAMVLGKDSIKRVEIIYRAVVGDSLDGLTYKTLKVAYFHVVGVDTLRDANNKPIYDTAKNVYKFKEIYDSIPKQNIYILSTKNLDSLSKAGW